VSVEQAGAALKLRSNQIAVANPSPSGVVWSAQVLPANQSKVRPTSAKSMRGFLGLLMGVSGLVLLIACINVAGMSLVRSASCSRDIGLRLALGATRVHLLRQSIAEALLLALLGGAAAVLFAAWLSSLLAGLKFSAWVELPPAAFDPRLFAFATGISLLASLLAAVAPAFYAWRKDVLSALKQVPATPGGGGAFAARWSLIAIQVALSLVLLAATGLLVRSLQNERLIQPGFETRHLLLASFDTQLQGYDKQRSAMFQQQLLERVEKLPGVRSASLAVVVPLSGRQWSNDIVLADDPGGGTQDREHNVSFNLVGPRYFETTGVPLLAGRDVSPADREGSPPVAVVNESMAHRFWPGQNPLGRRFREAEHKQWIEVVGLARDTKYRELREEFRPCYYLPIFQQPAGAVATLYVHTSGNPSALTGPVSAEVRALDDALPLFNVMTMESYYDEVFAQSRAMAGFAGLFSVLALMLSAVGLYGIVAYTVTQARHEIGIRMALGAGRQHVLRLFVGRALKIIAAGLALGLAGALTAGRLIAVFLYGVEPTDARNLGGVVLVLVVVTLAAAWLPARQASRVDPMEALRYE
jgi:predicted permease